MVRCVRNASLARASASSYLPSMARHPASFAAMNASKFGDPTARMSSRPRSQISTASRCNWKIARQDGRFV